LVEILLGRLERSGWTTAVLIDGWGDRISILISEVAVGSAA
jgi:hypothetical protein